MKYQIGTLLVGFYFASSAAIAEPVTLRSVKVTSYMNGIKALDVITPQGEHLAIPQVFHLNISYVPKVFQMSTEFSSFQELASHVRAYYCDLNNIGEMERTWVVPDISAKKFPALESARPTHIHSAESWYQFEGHSHMDHAYFSCQNLS